MFAQVSCYAEVQAGAVCKTVGSAYVGSNPTPATSFRRSKPVTLDCVTGFSRERERLRRPSALSCGPCVGQVRAVCVAARGAGFCALRCGNIRNSWWRTMSDPGLAAASLWAAAGTVCCRAGLAAPICRSGAEGGVDLLVEDLVAAVDAVGADGEQHGHAVPGAGGDLGGVTADVQP